MSYGYHNEALETASRDELRALQDRRLREIVQYVYDNNTEQRRRLDAAGVRPADIQSVDDLPSLPLMSKEDLRKSYPLGLCCVDSRDLVGMHMSSGSTGTPVVMPYTIADIHQWGECMARCYRMAGGEQGDVLQITPSFGLFNGGFGFFHGAREMGLFVIPTGAGNTARQIRLARDFKTRILTGVVSYGIRIMEVLEEQGADLPDLQIGIFGSETFSESMKQKLAEGLGVEIFDIYGMTESGGVGTLGMDCSAHNGTHVWEDHYIVEILDQ
ncbi:MAG: AMP-binding protein, partial [Armatimonadia bacterium]